MPHVILEYSTNVASVARSAQITKIVHNIMSQCGLFSSADIKTRSHIVEDFLVGEKGREGSFVHVTVYLLEGRTILQKQNLSEALLDALRVPLKNVDQLSIDIRELAKDTYRKYIRP